jgi:hypothetical protein
LGSSLLQSSINLFFVTVHPALYEDLIPYVHVAHDLESLVRSTIGIFKIIIHQLLGLQCVF